MTDVVSWRKTLPFIRDNRLSNRLQSPSWNAVNLISFFVSNGHHVGRQCLLECLDTKSGGMNTEAYFAGLQCLQPNTPFKTLRLSPVVASMGDAKMDQVVSLVKKKYL
jgi:hypothetical protein